MESGRPNVSCGLHLVQDPKQSENGAVMREGFRTQ